MKKIFFLITLLLILPSISAINITIERQSINEVLISELNMPAYFDLQITNNGPDDTFKIYNLVGFDTFPESVQIDKGETKELSLKVAPLGKLDIRGLYSFECFFRGQDESETNEKLTVRIIDLKDAFEIGSEEFDPESNSLEIYLYNKVNFDFENISAKFKSAFFDFEDSFNLGPNEKKSFNIKLNKEEFKKLMAGFYTMKTEVNVNDEKANIEGTIRFVEKNLVTSTKKDYGFVINTQIIEKTNEGNVVAESETVLKKNIISRLFTSFSPSPDIVERQGLEIFYTWDREIKPGETLTITVKTNWLFPLIVVLFVIAIVILSKKYTKTDLLLRKKVSFVKAKGGEFALKVSLIVNARKYIEKVSIIDRLPPLVKIHERFGGETPKRIDERNKRIDWGFEKLEAGEKRVISYIIYSKIGVLGKFSLPTTTAIYERDGKVKEATSNRAFFLIDQIKKEIED